MPELLAKTNCVLNVTQHTGCWVENRHSAKIVYEFLQVLHKVAIIGDFAMAVGVERVSVSVE